MSVQSAPSPNSVPEFGMCDVYKRGSVVVCINGRVSEYMEKNGKLIAKELTHVRPDGQQLCCQYNKV